MALVRYGGGITAMSGSIAGNTFARNRYGAYVRARTKPINPNSPAQVSIRTVIAFLTEYWGETLTAGQREGWATYAAGVVMKNKLAESIKLTGFNHFIRSNSLRKYHALSLVDTAPAELTIPEKDPTLTLDADSSPMKLAVTFDVNSAWNQEWGGKMFFLQGRPQNGTRNFFAGPWRKSSVWAGNVGGGPTSPFNIVRPFPIYLGQRQWIQIRISRADGRLSEPWQVLADVHGQAIGEVPNLLGLTQEEAVTLLTSPAVQLILGTVTTEHSEVVPIDLIISSDPVMHTQLSAGDPVNIVVSLGPAV